MNARGIALHALQASLGFRDRRLSLVLAILASVFFAEDVAAQDPADRSAKLLTLAESRFETLTDSERKLFQETANGRIANYNEDVEETRVLRADRIRWLCTDREATKHVLSHAGISINGATWPIGGGLGTLVAVAVGLGLSTNTRSGSGSVASTQAVAASANPPARAQILNRNSRDTPNNPPICPCGLIWPPV